MEITVQSVESLVMVIPETVVAVAKVENRVVMVGEDWGMEVPTD